MLNFTDGQSTLDEILLFFSNFSVYKLVEAYTDTPAFEEIVVVDDNDKVVAIFDDLTDYYEYEDDGTPTVYIYQNIEPRTFAHTVHEFLNDGFQLTIEKLN